MSDARAWRGYRAGLLAVDTVLLTASFAAAFAVRFRLGWFAVHDVTPDQRNYLLVGAAGLALWLAVFFARGLYRCEVLLAGTREYAGVVSACLTAFALAAVLSSLTGAAPFLSRGVLAAALPLSIVLAGGGRFAARRAALRLRRRGLFIARAVIIGAGDDGIAIARQFARAEHSGVEVRGFLDDFLPAGALVDGRWPVLGPPAALAGLAVDEAIVVPAALTWESHLELIQRVAAGEPGPLLHLAPGLFDLVVTPIHVTDRGSVPVVTARPVRIAGTNAAAKRLLEGSIALLLLALSVPGLAVWATRHYRPGRPLLQRRHYYGAGDAIVTASTLATGDAPASMYGRLVAGAPLLAAVLTGRLALIGPRPRAVSGDGAAGHHSAVRSVRPGLTGPAPVFLPDGPDDQALALELRYVRDYSIWRDLQLLWRCAGQMARTPAHGRRTRGIDGQRPNDRLALPSSARQPNAPPDPTAARPSPLEAP